MSQVLQTLEPIDTEILTKDQRSFLRRILPFRTPDHGIEGVVVTFIDLTAHNRAAAEQRERDACFRKIFDHAPLVLRSQAWMACLSGATRLL